MSAPDRTTKTNTANTTQEVVNKSQDGKHEVLAVMLLGENAAGTAPVRIKADASGALAVAGGTGGSASTPTTVFSGRQTVNGATPVALSATKAIRAVTVKALASNTASVFVGASNVSAATGFELLAGGSVSLDIADLASVYIVSVANNTADGVTYLGVA